MLPRPKQFPLHHARMKMLRPAALGVLEANPLNKYHNSARRGHGRINSSPIPSLSSVIELDFERDKSQITTRSNGIGAFHDCSNIRVRTGSRLEAVGNYERHERHARERCSTRLFEGGTTNDETHQGDAVAL